MLPSRPHPSHWPLHPQVLATATFGSASIAGRLTAGSLSAANATADSLTGTAVAAVAQRCSAVFSASFGGRQCHCCSNTAAVCCHAPHIQQADSPASCPSATHAPLLAVTRSTLLGTKLAAGQEALNVRTLAVVNTLRVARDQTVAGELSVGGALSTSGTLSTNGALSVARQLTVGGAATIRGAGGQGLTIGTEAAREYQGEGTGESGQPSRTRGQDLCAVQLVLFSQPTLAAASRGCAEKQAHPNPSLARPAAAAALIVNGGGTIRRNAWVEGNITGYGEITAKRSITTYGDVAATGKVTAGGGLASTSAVLTGSLNAQGACTCAKPPGGRAGLNTHTP